jgi:hypothetical protein
MTTMTTTTMGAIVGDLDGESSAAAWANLYDKEEELELEARLHITVCVTVTIGSELSQ